MFNKFIKTILSLVLVVSSLVILEVPIIKPLEVQADQYAMACNNYEVSTVNANGTFTKVNCTDSFSSAQKIMWGYGQNAVVRHHTSKSPMKIISMNVGDGLAVTYPARSSSSTMDITQDINNSNKKKTYVTQHREMRYEGTYDYNGNGNGTIKVNITGFSGLTDLVNVDLVPFAFIKNEARVLLGGNDTTGKNEQSFWTHVYQSHYDVVQNGANKELVFKSYSGWSGPSTYPDVYTMVVGLAADWMNVGTTYYSYDGYNFYSDFRYTSKVGTYYNYYQFLPTRTASNIPANVFDNFLMSVKGSGTNSKMKGQGQNFINAQNSYGINALLVYALACLESAYGTSNFALDRNNLFGWNAFDSSPGSASYFPSIEAAINEHMGINLRGYTDINDSRFFGSHVGNKGSGFNVKYAADPYWGYKIASIAYSIDKAAGFVDYNKYSVGVVNKYGVNVLKTPGGATLYNSAYGQTYQENFTVAVLGNESNHYKIQSTNPLSGGKLIDGGTKGLVNYDWNSSVGFLPTGNVNLINSNTPPIVDEPGSKPDGDFISKIETLIFNKGKLTITGYAYQPGIYINDLESVKHYLVLTDSKNNKTEILLDKSIYGKENYGAAGFLGSMIDLTTLPKEEKYSFSIKTIHKEYTTEKPILNIKGNEELINNYVYTLSSSTSLTTLEIKKRVIPERLIKSLDSITVSEKGIANISGYAYVEGKNNSKDNISHRIEVINLDNDNIVKKIDLETTTGKYDPTQYSNHGLDYSNCWYKGQINLLELGQGEFKFNLITTVEGKEFVQLLLGNPNVTTYINDFANNLNTNLFVNYLYSARLELQNNLYKIEVNSPNKLPSSKTGYQYLSKISINEATNELKVQGSGYIQNASFSTEDNPKFTVYLINQKDGKVFSSTVNGLNKFTDSTLSWNNSEGKNYNYDYTWFETIFNLSDLPDGNYLMKLKIETNSYAELVDFTGNNDGVFIDYSKDGKKLYAKRNQFNKLRVQIDVSGFYNSENDAKIEADQPLTDVIDKEKDVVTDTNNPEKTN